MDAVINKIYLAITIISFISIIINLNNAEELTVGDTINILESKNSINKVADIFNSYDGSKFIEKKNFNDIIEDYFLVADEFCLTFESLKFYYYPQVFLDGVKNYMPSNFFGYMDNSRDEFLGINSNYVNNVHFKYGIVKVCKIVETEYLNIEIIDDKYFPNISSGANYNILVNKTVVFRLKRDSETHYISSISTGTCLLQIYINDAHKCFTNDTYKSLNHKDSFFKNPIFKGHITTLSNNHSLENFIDHYYLLNNIDYSLFTFSDLAYNYKVDILSKFENDAIVRVNLSLLPELPRHKKLLPSSNKIKPVGIVPGDILNLDDLLDDTLTNISTDNVLIDSDDYVTMPFVSYNYTKCYDFDKNNDVRLEFGGYLLPDKFPKGDYKLNYFEETVRRKYYGVDRTYLYEHYTCLKITVCSQFIKKKLHFPLFEIIKLDEQSKDNNKYNIFENFNILLWYTKNNETHYVTRTENGDCLFQALVFPFELEYYLDNSRFNHDPIHKGKILSATNNTEFELRTQLLSNNDLRVFIGANSNILLTLKTFDGLDKHLLTNNGLINVYLDKMY
ncbi:uncharacterized protein LOC130667772 [Microplitis mediator]|uniref:uncharacterized protein LOC130667772 n=1 Tax=Microplitis mediator TaxID=375433 RepID=UPI0025533E8E|nr:uncharacterized protein LOC130667772 [Microplitis mediator]